MQIKTIATIGITEKVETSPEFCKFVISSLDKHFRGDWGEVSEADSVANTSDPLNALSAYTDPDGVKIWVRASATIRPVALMMAGEKGSKCDVFLKLRKQKKVLLLD